jgi:hypothetical protein
VLCTDPPHALPVIAGAALGLLLLGIRNAWDTVTHVILTGSDDDTATR